MRVWKRDVAIGLLAVALSATLTAVAKEVAGETSRYTEVETAIGETMNRYLYDPAELGSERYKAIARAVRTLANEAESDEAFVEGFGEIWRDGPFSHVSLRVAQQTASQVTDYLDTLRIGGGGATLSWQGDTAVLTVHTMMGLDTIEEIDAAYAEIAERGANALIIDLRNNGGGAFAVRPLVSHLLTDAVDAGAFMSRRWYAEHRRGPAGDDVSAVEPWEGWSIRTFWNDVERNALTRLRFSPAEPVFSGPVYVLTSGQTASAAELAVDALKSADRAVIIGERTAGEMLSQRMFDLPHGFQLSLPIADYHSLANGRIEGAGIEPDIGTNPADALEVALRQLSLQ